ncbi:dynamin family protein [Mesobacterium pallidum]|uniref:dynamin family protein n=1 Tax=Mesobacterium pallidum TaxID=2872037 RepID=UPI001EE162CC|nr:dynamin family protein [Mesobacterium pallidum]
MKIAPAQRQELDFLRDTLDNLEKAAGRDKRDIFRGLRRRLDGWAAKVAVIGQVKAGKSTFLNAFLYNHDFLPSDVNPWTSVVTNIRINLPQDPISGGSFEFFAERDWDEIVSGESKIRKLTEQLLPGFDTKLLRKQSEEMRIRAEERLGKSFKDLLGTAHDYDFVTSDLLKAYVCAGPGMNGGKVTDATGQYSALTKVAHVYTRLPEFQVPTIITDTPGVNDPFLVRDEFTCRSLDKSDVFIVVLSAHQPLTDVDIALIRILAKQDNKDVMIFVNRIDELDDYDTDVPRVLDDVSRRLKGAIPDIDFSIVAGSGYMADLTLQDGEEAEEQRAALDDARLARYLKSRYGQVPEDRDDRLLLASGIGAIKSELSKVIDRGIGSSQLATIKGDIRAELEGVLFVNRRARDTLQTQVSHINGDVAAMAISDLKGEIETLKALHAKLEEQADSTEVQIEKVVGKAWSRLEKRLLGCIETFVDNQKTAFESHLFASKVRGGGSGKSLTIDLAPLQRAMEREVETAWTASRTGNDVVLNNCLTACRQILKDSYGDDTAAITLDDLPHQDFVSTLTLAQPALKVNLIANRSWAFWKKKTFNVEKTLEALRTIAAEELRPPIEKILAAFNEAQIERATAGNDRIHVMLRMFESSFNQRMHGMKKEMIEYEKVASDPDFRRVIVQRVQSQMEVIERRLINLSAIESSLARSDLAKAA